MPLDTTSVKRRPPKVVAPERCEDCGLLQDWHLTADECEDEKIDPGLRDGLGCAVRVDGQLLRVLRWDEDAAAYVNGHI